MRKAVVVKISSKTPKSRYPMQELLKLAVHLVQEFQPIAPFYTNILIEEKLLQVYEISNKILPFYFYSSFATLIFCSAVIELLGHGLSLVVLLYLQIIMLIIIAFMRARCLWPAKIAYSLGGFVNVYKCVLRVMLINTGSSASYQLGRLKLLRQITIALAAWVGQGIYNLTQNYNIIIALSMLTTAIAGVGSLFAIKGEVAGTADAVVEYFTSPREFWRKTRSECDREVTVGLMAGGTSSLMLLYLSLFSQAIFHEAAGAADDAQGAGQNSFLGLIDIPIHAIAASIVKIFTALSPMFGASARKLKGRPVKSGYVEGTIKIGASLVSTLLVRHLGGFNRARILMVTLPFSIIVFHRLATSRHSEHLKLLYFVTLTLVICSEVIGKSYLHRMTARIPIATFMLFIESIVHSLINSLCRLFTLKSETKSAIYAGIATFSFLLAACVLSS